MSTENNPYIRVVWEDNPINFTQERLERVKNYFRKKYESKRITVITKSTLDDSELLSSIDVSEKVIDVNYQSKLVKEYIETAGFEVEWERFKKLDEKVETKLLEEGKRNRKHTKWKIRWIEFDNFLSFGQGNRVDFDKLGGITTVDSIPSNYGGKTTLTIDLLLFLFFNTTTKSAKAIDIFNRFTNKNVVLVRGMVTIDGEDYIIERGIIKKQTRKGDWTVKTELNFHKRLKDGALLNLEGEQRRETEKFIQDSIGNLDDFLLTILATGNNVEDIIEAKPTQRGHILTRFIGLEYLREKEKVGKEMYSAWSKKLISNIHNIDTLKEKIESLNKEIEDYRKKIEEGGKTLDSLDIKIKKLEKERDELISKQHTDIDEELVKLNPTDLKKELEEKKEEIKNKEDKSKDFKAVEPKSIFDEKTYSEVLEKKDTNNNEYITLEIILKKDKETLKTLEESEFCPVCKKPLEDVDHTTQIKELKVKIKTKEKEFKSLEKEKTKLESSLLKIEKVKKEFEDYEKIKLLEMKYELDIERLKNQHTSLEQKLNNWNNNKSNLEENRKLEKEIIEVKTKLEGVTSDKNNIISNKLLFKREINSNKEDIEENNRLIKQIEQEEKIDTIFKAYLMAFGKNGISKIILKQMVPYINNELIRLLSDSTEFVLDVRLNEKHEVEFWMVDNSSGVEKPMSGGSGYERTLAALALRAVLAKVCSLPKPNIVCFDEVFGKVSNENLEFVGKFFNKIRDYFEKIIIISHNPLVKEWCDGYITVEKKNNISNLID